MGDAAEVITAWTEHGGSACPEQVVPVVGEGGCPPTCYAAPDPTEADESVRRAAAANPGLTPEALEALLADARTAEGAAANPSLAVPGMHALLDRCLNGAATSPSGGH